jgi:hypothetical protein
LPKLRNLMFYIIKKKEKKYAKKKKKKKFFFSQLPKIKIKNLPVNFSKIKYGKYWRNDNL